ncbi:hypothetical protein [Persicirhabdus sediminis]|uniref:Addiction module component n=1 Tax=Persicirhabdus sediminis TaxID=454144 RepID=A0A8J7SPN3_9BACT|nr:hypothetical protein [Persicirhabdus sediminis]MBK1792453.1 hypothetical protein [Persicirhabdus sediminis]
MANLVDVQRQAAALTFEEKEGLLAFLIHELPVPFAGVSDREILEREQEMDSASVELLSHEDFLSQVGRD